MSAMSDYLESGLIGHIFRDVSFTKPSEIWVGLVGNYNSGALESGIFTQELSGGSYVRQSGGPGTSYWKEPSSTPKNVTNGDSFSFASGDLDILFK